MKRILIVDDDEDIRELIARALTGNFEICTAENGDEALGLMANITFDAIVLDYMMPGLDGGDTIACARKLGVNVPIVLTSAAIERTQAMALGADDFVSKPFDIHALAERVGRAAA